MYHKNNKKRLSAIIAAVAAAMTLATAGGTLAFLVDKTDTVENTFTPSKVSCAVNETFNGKRKTDVSIQNTGDTEAYIRAAIVVTWRDSSNNVYGVPVKDGDYSMKLNLSASGWFKGSDGYYYYAEEVEGGKSTADLIESCAPVSGKAPEGCTLSVEILADAIQSRPEDAVEDAWDVTVGSNGNISK